MAKVLIIIAPEGYQDKEYKDTRTALEQAGHQTITASTQEEAHGKLGETIKTDILLGQVNSENYDAISFIGGPGCSIYFENQTALNLAKSFYKAGKTTAAICAAPSILANAGILEQKNATCFPSEAENLKNKGATYTGNPTEQDGKIITGNGPDAATEFGQKIASTL